MNDENLTFISSSEYGSMQTGNRTWGHPTPWASSGYLPTDFAGMNTNVFEPVESSTNTLGYPAGTGLVSGTPAYRNSAFIPAVLGGHVPEMFNALILHRQGPYGWPSWKQVRVGNHPVNRVHRKNNIISYADRSVSTNPAYIIGGLIPAPFPILVANTTSFQFTESAISNRYNPLDHLFTVEQGGKSQLLSLRHSYGNLKSHYSTEKYNIKLVFPNDFKNAPDSVYDDLKKIYIDKDFDFPATTPFKLWHKFTYSENVFPREKNTYLNRTRKRTNFTETSGSNDINRRDFQTFWKDELADRNIRTNNIAINSQGYQQRTINSVWSLDTGGTSYGARTGVGELCGVLQQGSSIFTTLYNLTGTLSLYRGPSSVTPSPADKYMSGIPFYATDQISGKKPFFNSYNDFAEDIRGIGKDYTILPEFRVSDHMNYYVDEKEGDFLATNSAFLTMPGGNVTSSAASFPQAVGIRSEITASLERPIAKNSEFFAEYSHSDFLKYFDKFYDDHKNEGKLSRYSFYMKGIKKLLPYKGFYPHQRALQLGSILSQSYGLSITGSTVGAWIGGGFPDRPATQFLNAFLRPLASPGIMFNSLKSAIAVDYPVFTGSAANLDVGSDASTSPTLYYWESSPNYRLPFEAVIQPHVYLPIPRAAEFEANTWAEKSINFDEPQTTTPSSYLFSFALKNAGSQLYSLAANNFFGEVPRFFLEQGRLTTFSSDLANNFSTAKNGKRYYMDVVLRKTSKMVLSEGQYEEPASPYQYFKHTRGAYYGPPVSSAWANDINGSNIRDPAYAPYTPPYFYEESIARIQFVGEGKKPTLSEIFASAEAETEFTGSSVALGLNDIASKTKMTISASINLFGTTKVKEVEYLTGIGPEGNFIPVTAKDTVAEGFDAWSIGSKFECPALNFVSGSSFHTSKTGRGLWGGYGVTPKKDDGVWIDIRESFPARGATAIDQALTGSLIDLCGFTSKSKRIGKPAKSKLISEAIVAIPFVYNVDPSAGEEVFSNFIAPLSGGRKFFKISQAIWNNIIADVDAGNNPNSVSIADMYNKMRKYYLPPQFNCVDFPEAVRPIVMYMFEFEHVLSQQDLTDIWQGLMPKISTQAEEAMSSIEHKSGEREFFHGLDLPKQTRWMVFKVKRRAEKSYFATTADTTDDARFKFQFNNVEKPPEYNYNWPYDFFSLVELAKMDASVEFTRPPSIMEQIAEQQGTAQAAPGAGAGAIPAGGLLGGGE
tara:strand:- start:6756 stop:10436 length:3681 start_codon:yes stop_codon:yes gene_type:complete